MRKSGKNRHTFYFFIRLFVFFDSAFLRRKYFTFLKNKKNPGGPGFFKRTQCIKIDYDSAASEPDSAASSSSFMLSLMRPRWSTSNTFTLTTWPSSSTSVTFSIRSLEI